MSSSEGRPPSAAIPEPDPGVAAEGSDAGMMIDEPDHELAIVRQQIASSLFPRSKAAPTQTIGRFVVERRLGAGAMGVVYAARDPALERRVAIKLVRPEVGSDRKAQLRLEREARALAKVSHPNIVAIHEVGEHRGQVFLAMEHVQGESLRVWQQRSRRSVSEVLAMYVQAGRGLAAAHAAGLVHRDFKPDNVLVDAEGRARVVDFGLVSNDDEGRRAELARWQATAGHSEVPRMTHTHALVGTPAYMSPEQFEGGAVDARSDQFGFCVALYEALYGQHPFEGDSLLVLSKAVLDGRVRQPPVRSPVPTRVRRLLLRGLAVPPGDRHPSLDALLDALSYDPAVTRRRWLAVGGLVLGASIGTHVLAGRGVPEVTPCMGLEEELADVWNEERRTTVAAAIHATGLPYAEQTWARVEPAVDAYGTTWVEMRTQACEAHHAGLESDRHHDLRVACLERRRVALEALVGVLAEPTRKDVENAVQAAAALPPIASCGDAEALAAAIPPPEDPELAQAVEAHRGTLARAHEYEVLGRYDAARELATAVLDSTEARAHAPLEAEAALSLGAIELATLQYKSATDAFTRAIVVGLRTGHLDVAAEAFARRLFTSSALGHMEAASHDVPLARALVERSEDGQLEWLLANNIAALRYELGQVAEAKEAFLEALEVKERLHGRDHFEYALTLSNVSVTEWDLGNERAAEVLTRRSRELLERAFGSEHPLVSMLVYTESLRASYSGRLDAAYARMPAAVAQMADAHGSHAEMLFTYYQEVATLCNERGAYAEALDYIGRAIAVTEVHDLDHHASRIDIFIRHAVALAGLGRHDEAMAELEQGLALTERALNPQHAPSDILDVMVRFALERGDVDDALALSRRSLALRERDPAAEATDLARTELHVARALHAHGALDDALDMALRALERFREALPGRYFLLVDYRRELGDILLDLGRTEEALEQYEIGHRGLSEMAEPHTPKLAKLELAMARALLRTGRGGQDVPAENRARSKALALGALTSLRRYAPGFDTEIAAAKQLLGHELAGSGTGSP